MALRNLGAPVGNLPRDDSFFLLNFDLYQRQATAGVNTGHHFEVNNDSYYETDGTLSFRYKNNADYSEKITCNKSTDNTQELEISIQNRQGLLYDNIPEHHFIIVVETEED